MDIRIELTDGTAIHRRIAAAVELDAAREQLALDAELPSPIPPGSVRRIHYMALMRAASDAVTIRHLTDGDGAAEAEITFRQVRES